MKKYLRIGLLAVASFFCYSQPVAAQEGTWAGNLKIGHNTIKLVFHLQGDQCTMDSPDQGAKGIAVQRIKSTVPALTLSIPAIGAEYKGVWMGKQIVGTFKQRGIELPLTLKPGAASRNRPQTPKGPFPYNCEEVTFTNQDATLKGTLTLPQNCNQQTPVLLMVTGSGAQNRNEEIFEHKPFAVIADALARQGIATLRYDDRGFGESTGDLKWTTTEDLKKDALAGVQLLRQRFQKVGILGHSEGGTIGLALAADHKVDFVVSLAGMVISGKETLMAQNEDILQQYGYSKEVRKEYLRVLEDLFDKTIQGKAAQPYEGTTLPDELKKNLQQVAMSLQVPYLQYFLKMDPRKNIDRIQCPVLALNGTKDRQVDCHKNLDLLQRGLRNPKSKIVPCEGLNHLFQHCTTGAVSEYKDIEETFSAQVINQIIEWLKTL